jgi:hypothetical protein
MENISRFNLVRHLEKRNLLIAVNSVAALSIFYFGYDQGVMGGVNNNRNFAETMGYGYFSEKENQVIVTKSALKGGIVSPARSPARLKCDCKGLISHDSETYM